MRILLSTVVTLILLLSHPVTLFAQAVPEDYQKVLTFLNRKGDFKANVLKVNIPRSDLSITIDGFAVPTPYGFGGWLAMTKGKGGNEVMMGDLVLLEDEVNPVLSALLDNGIEATALHNHFFWDNPHMFYMHVHGFGKAEELAHRVKPALDIIGTIKSHIPNAPQPHTPLAVGTFDANLLDSIVGSTGDKLAGGVYKYTVGRDDLKVKEMGAIINARMGLNSWAALFGSDSNAIIAGDIAMLEPEVNTVLKTLRANGLSIVSIHHHMVGSKPTIIFLHYWGQGAASKLAVGFKAALDVLGKKSSAMSMR